jgi:preprotein translocase subunit SecA
VIFFESLDEPFMKKFAGDWVSGMLKQLGMEECDAIESPMILRRIKAAQSKFDKNASGDGPAKSAEEWLERYGG